MCTAALATSADAVRTTSATATPAAVPTPPVSDVAANPANVARKSTPTQMPTFTERLTGSYSLVQS